MSAVSCVVPYLLSPSLHCNVNLSVPCVSCGRGSQGWAVGAAWCWAVQSQRRNSSRVYSLISAYKHLKAQTHHWHPAPAHSPRELQGTQHWGELAEGGCCLPCTLPGVAGPGHLTQGLFTAGEIQTVLSSSSPHRMNSTDFVLQKRTFAVHKPKGPVVQKHWICHVFPITSGRSGAVSGWCSQQCALH